MPTEPTTATAVAMAKPSPAPIFGVHIEQRTYDTKEWRFIVQDGPHRVTMDVTKANWQWIQDMAKKHNIECELPQAIFDLLPSSHLLDLGFQVIS